MLRTPAAKPARERIAAALGLTALVLVIYAFMAVFSGADPAGCPYNSYQLQAQAWLDGRLSLEKNYEYLELALYEGNYYVSFPPVPGIPWVIWTLLMGENVPGGLIQKLYIAIACMIVCSEIIRSKGISPLQGAIRAAGICLCSAMLPVGLVGGVWYEAQILAFLFSAGAIAAIRRDHPTLCCLLYALAVGCRPFSVLLGPALLAMHLRRGGGWRRLVPGVCLGLMIAAGYGAYNFARFGNIFEFGHNYLPEFTRAEHGQLSLRYLPGNLKQMLFGSPFIQTEEELKFYEFGFSMFVSCPVLICGLVWLMQDLRRKRMCAVKWIALITGMLNTLLLAMHRTLGGHQFGLRYALELIPLCLIWLLESPERRRISAWEAALLSFGLIFNFAGGCLVHILRYT